MRHRRQKLQQQMAARLLADSLGLGTSSRRDSDAARPTARQPASVPISTLPEMRGLVLDLEAMTATKEGQSLSLTPTEFRLLVTLMKRSDHPHTFQELAQVTHGQRVDSLQARDLLKSPVGRLRRKLGTAPDGAAYIVNVRGVGYKFVSHAAKGS
jgi:DNA-binding response OmpR family regulator